MTEIADQKAILRVHLEKKIREALPELKKPQVDEVLKFVTKYFGQDMHGQTDKAEFRQLVEQITERIGSEVE